MAIISVDWDEIWSVKDERVWGWREGRSPEVGGGGLHDIFTRSPRGKIASTLMNSVIIRLTEDYY